MAKRTTAELWEKQDLGVGDRRGLYDAVAAATGARRVLYPGSYVDVAPSFSFAAVTYVDVDKRAKAFFADVDGVAAIVADNDGPPDASVTFLHADYTDPLDLDAEAFDLLISLYAGFVSEHCAHHLRTGGTLLVNSSHGDAAMASIDPRLELAGVVISRDETYRVDTDGLERFMIPKRDQAITVESLHASGRGVAYTTSPFAYLFTRRR